MASALSHPGLPVVAGGKGSNPQPLALAPVCVPLQDSPVTESTDDVPLQDRRKRWDKAHPEKTKADTKERVRRHRSKK